MRDEPAAWFDVTSVIGGDREAMAAVLAALEAELGQPVRLWTPRGRGGYCVTLAGEGAPYAEL